MAAQNSVIYVETEPGRFEIRRVVLGATCGDQIVVLSGVKQGEQVATRGALAKILKNRADKGKGFPEEIELPQVEIPGPNDTKIIPILQQLHCDDGWLAIGYRLP